MSRKYKFGEKEGAYFVSFATVNWKYTNARNYGNDYQTVLEIDIN